MPYFLITNDKFKTLEADLNASSEIKKVEMQNDYQGVITTNDVTLSFSYDQNSNKLTYEIGARHSLAAHMASDNIIANHITKLLSNFLAAPVPSPTLTTAPIAVPTPVPTPVPVTTEPTPVAIPVEPAPTT